MKRFIKFAGFIDGAKGFIPASIADFVDEFEAGRLKPENEIDPDEFYSKLDSGDSKSVYVRLWDNSVRRGDAVIYQYLWKGRKVYVITKKGRGRKRRAAFFVEGRIEEGTGRAKSYRDLIDELREMGYKVVSTPKKAGFVFPDGSIVEIGDEDHSVIGYEDRERFGILTYRFDSEGSLYLRIEGDVSLQQERALRKFKPNKWIFIDVDGHSLEFEAREVDDLGYLVSKVAKNPAMFRRMSYESLQVHVYETYVKKVLNEYKSLISLLEASDKQKECAKKYAVLDKDGNIKHFKGPPGKGIRFRNCVEYFKCLGKSEEQAKGICAEIARRKCVAGAKYACGRR